MNKIKTVLPIFMLLTIIFSNAYAHDYFTALQQTEDQIEIENAIPDSTKGTIAEIIPLSFKGTPTNEQLLAAFLVILIGFLVIHYVSRGLEILVRKQSFMHLKAKRLLFIFRTLSWLLVFYIIVVEVLVLPQLTYIVLLSFVLLTIGLATRDLVKNILGGIMILFDKPFKVGDKVMVENYYGEIVSIDLRTTSLLTRDNKFVIIPNGNISREIVANANKGDLNKKIITDFYLPVTMDTKLLKKIATRAVSVSKYAYLIKPVEIIFKNEIYEGKPILKMTVVAYVSDLRYEEAFSSEITELVMDYLLKNSKPEMLRMISNN